MAKADKGTSQESTIDKEGKTSQTSSTEFTTVRMQSNFYKDSFTRLLFVLLLSVALNFGLISTLLYMLTHPPKPKYFATSINGRITPLSPLDMPNQSDSAVLQWANEAAIAAYTYNFVNYTNELQSASRYFTRTGWGQFLTALSNAGSLEIVKQKKLIVSAVATRSPIILQKGPLNGHYAWRIQMPLMVTYQSASDFMQNNVVVTMLVRRVSTLETPRGIGISQFIVNQAGTIV